VLPEDALDPTALTDDPALPPVAVSRRRFRPVLWMILLTHGTYFMVFPFIPLYLVQTMGATEGFVAAYSVVELLAGAMIALLTTPLIKRVGNHAMLGVGVLLNAVAVGALLLAPSLGLTLFGGIIIGAGWTAIGVSLLGFFGEYVLAQNARQTTYFNQAIGLSMFIAPLLGSLLLDAGISVAGLLAVGVGVHLLVGSGIILNVLPRMATVQGATSA